MMALATSMGNIRKIIYSVIVAMFVLVFVGKAEALSDSRGIKRLFFDKPIPERLCDGSNENSQELQLDHLGPVFQTKITILEPPTEVDLFSGPSSDSNARWGKVWVQVERVLQGKVSQNEFYVYFSKADSGVGIGSFPKDAVGKSFYILGRILTGETFPENWKGKIFVIPLTRAQLENTEKGTCFSKD